MENLRKTVLFPCGYPHYLGHRRGGVDNCRVIHGVIQRLSTGLYTGCWSYPSLFSYSSDNTALLRHP